MKNISYPLKSESSSGRLKLSLLKQVRNGVTPKSFYVFGSVCNLQGIAQSCEIFVIS